MRSIGIEKRLEPRPCHDIIRFLPDSETMEVADWWTEHMGAASTIA